MPCFWQMTQMRLTLRLRLFIQWCFPKKHQALDSHLSCGHRLQDAATYGTVPFYHKLGVADRSRTG